MKDFIHPDWIDIFKANHLSTFNELWEKEAPWFEPPNKRRGGWSGVSRIVLQDLAGNDCVFFLKRQENHLYKPLRNLIKGAPTFRREMKNIQRFIKHGIPIPTPVFYAERTVNHKIRAILITASIAPEYRSLEEWLVDWDTHGFPPKKDYDHIIETVAKAISKMHRHYIKHGALVTKHLFLKYELNQPAAVRFIDLEKTRYWFLPYNGSENDLKAFGRSALPYVSKTNVLQFYKAYEGINMLNKRQTEWVKQMGNRLKHARKSK